MDGQNLQGAAYYEWLMNNAPDQATRVAAQNWLMRNGSGGGTGKNAGVANKRINPAVHGPINIDNPAIVNAMKNDARLAKNIQTLYSAGDNSLDSLISAMSSENYTGMPFDAKTAQEEVNRQMGVLNPFYDAERTKESSDINDVLGKAKADFEAGNAASAEQFKIDKEASDVDAANKGVLFSSGRVQKLNSLQGAYAADQAKRLRDYGTNTSLAARDYQYKYGNDAAKNTLSNYLNAGGNTYDAMTPGGAVGSTGLSAIYNPSATTFYGTNRAKQRSEAVQRAAGVLKSKSNKLVPYGYLNQL